MSQEDSYWIVACSASEQNREAIYTVLKSRISNQLCKDTALLEVPLAMKYGSFDELVRLVDDLAKYDTQVEGILRRIERQYLEIDSNAAFRIAFQRNSLSIDQYIRRFTWDDSKYPRTRLLRDNIDILVQSVQKLDDELRGKALAFNEVRQTHSAVSKKEGGTFVQKDLTDVLVPDLIAPNDFIETEHLTTAVVCVPHSLKDVWLKTYESLDAKVVPRSAKKFNVIDKEKNELWRVVVFRSVLEKFREAAKANRFIVREFRYSQAAYSSKQEERTRLEAEKNRQENFLSRICAAVFSDAFIAWIHLKSMRVFVEAVLRFGLPPNFAAFFIKLLSTSKEKKLRQELNDVFTTRGMFGRSYIQGSRTAEEAGVDMGEAEYHPYVSLDLTPLASKS